MTGEEATAQVKVDYKGIIGLALALLVQTCTIVWWASGISAKVEEGRSIDAKQDFVINSLTVGRESNASRITSLEASKTNIETKLNRIEDKLDRLIEAKQ